MSRWRLEGQQTFSVMQLAQEKEVAICWPVRLGVQLGQNHVDLSFRWSMWRDREWVYLGDGTDLEYRFTFFGTNVHYDRSMLRLDYLDLRLGAAVGLWWLNKTDIEIWEGYPTYDYTEVSDESGMAWTVGPEMHVAVGLEGFKITTGFSYLVWLHEDMQVFSFQDSFWFFEWGFAFRF